MKIEVNLEDVQRHKRIDDDLRTTRLALQKVQFANDARNPAVQSTTGEFCHPANNVRESRTNCS